MAKLSLTKLSKSFGATPAVREVSLEVKDGEFLVLVGPSGCGKTTVLRLIAGLEQPSEGEIYIGDKLANGVPPRDRNVAMVFQNYALYPHMTVFENMAFGLRNRRIPRDEIERRVKKAAEVLEMQAFLRRRPGELSGGQRQRVALGRAIVREPKCFLMDEPLSNLDPKLRVQTRAELVKLQRRLATTTIYVTHDQMEAMTMGDRIAVMREGAIQQLGAPLEVYRQPSNVFVASFIGSPPMNLIPAVLRREDSIPASQRPSEPDVRLLADAEGLNLRIPPGRKKRWQSLSQFLGKNILVGIRPEDIEVAAGQLQPDAQLKPSAQDNLFSARAEVVEPTGAQSILYLSLENHSLLAVVPADTAAREGETIQIRIDPQRCHIFDAESEEAIK